MEFPYPSLSFRLLLFVSWDPDYCLSSSSGKKDLPVLLPFQRSWISSTYVSVDYVWLEKSVGDLPTVLQCERRGKRIWHGQPLTIFKHPTFRSPSTLKFSLKFRLPTGVLTKKTGVYKLFVTNLQMKTRFVIPMFFIIYLGLSTVHFVSVNLMSYFWRYPYQDLPYLTRPFFCRTPSYDCGTQNFLFLLLHWTFLPFQEFGSLVYTFPDFFCLPCQGLGHPRVSRLSELFIDIDRNFHLYIVVGPLTLSSGSSYVFLFFPFVDVWYPGLHTSSSGVTLRTLDTDTMECTVFPDSSTNLIPRTVLSNRT